MKTIAVVMVLLSGIPSQVQKASKPMQYRKDWTPGYVHSSKNQDLACAGKDSIERYERLRLKHEGEAWSCVLECLSGWDRTAPARRDPRKPHPWNGDDQSCRTLKFDGCPYDNSCEQRCDQGTYGLTQESGTLRDLTKVWCDISRACKYQDHNCSLGGAKP